MQAATVLLWTPASKPPDWRQTQEVVGLRCCCAYCSSWFCWRWYWWWWWWCPWSSTMLSVTRGSVVLGQVHSAREWSFVVGGGGGLRRRSVTELWVDGSDCDELSEPTAILGGPSSLSALSEQLQFSWQNGSPATGTVSSAPSDARCCCDDISFCRLWTLIFPSESYLTCRNLRASASLSRRRWCSTSSSATFSVCGGVAMGGSGDGGGGNGGSSLSSSSSDWRRTPSVDAERCTACSDGAEWVVTSTATLVSELTLRRSSSSSSMRDSRQSSKKRARNNIFTPLSADSTR